jgi:type IV pilus assembly protein PilP
MSNSILIIRNLALVFCFAAWLFGCGEKQDEAPVKSTVSSHKITIEKDKTPASEVNSSESSPKAAPSEVAVEMTDASKATEAQQGAPGDTSTAAIPGSKETMEDATDVPNAPAPKKSITLGPGTSLSDLAEITYASEGKIDPFVPLFRPEPKVPDSADIEDLAGPLVKPRPRRLPQTPLEEMEVNQLKLVAIIRSGTGNKALVQDATGKGYVLNKGTYIGTKAGIVKQITKDKVIIEEEEENETVDTDGLVMLRERELTLKKPVGEI